eukprot:scaffold20429_cov19-Tisochrysis_lutea.AAC.1
MHTAKKPWQREENEGAGDEGDAGQGLLPEPTKLQRTYVVLLELCGCGLRKDDVDELCHVLFELRHVLFGVYVLTLSMGQYAFLRVGCSAFVDTWGFEADLLGQCSACSGWLGA